MRVDHGLYAVTKVELLEDAGDVRLGGCLADHEPLADLGIGEAPREQVEDFLLAVSVPRRRRCGVGAGACRANSSITDRDRRRD
jgi:hypothetical protein